MQNVLLLQDYLLHNFEYNNLYNAKGLFDSKKFSIMSLRKAWFLKPTFEFLLDLLIWSFSPFLYDSNLHFLNLCIEKLQKFWLVKVATP